MTIPGRAHVVAPGHGRIADLGVAQMRLLASGDATNGGAFALAEFSGTGEGAWTVPHLHRGFEESFFILDGLFTFTVGEEAIAASSGMYILVPRGPHTRSAQPQAEAGSCC
jgi:mannose-6-phosphate isomerase-like protein (cupin superfamily)